MGMIFKLLRKLKQEKVENFGSVWLKGKLNLSPNKRRMQIKETWKSRSIKDILSQ